MAISLNSYLFFLPLIPGQLPTGQDPGPRDNPPIKLKPNPQVPVPEIPNQPKITAPESFDQEPILKRLILLTHNSLLPNDLNVLLEVLRKLDNNRPSSKTETLIKSGINLQLVPTGDGTYQSQRFSGRFSFQHQDVRGSIFVDNRGNDTHGNPLPPVTYEIGDNGELILNTSRTKPLLWTEPLSKLKAYKNIFGTYSTYGEDYELVPQADASIYDKTNKRTYVKKGDTWQWDTSLTKPLATTEYITKYNLSPHQDSDNSFVDPRHPDLKCYLRNNGSLVYVGKEQAGGEEKVWTSNDGNTLSLFTPSSDFPIQDSKNVKVSIGSDGEPTVSGESKAGQWLISGGKTYVWIESPYIKSKSGYFPVIAKPSKIQTADGEKDIVEYWYGDKYWKADDPTREKNEHPYCAYAYLKSVGAKHWNSTSYVAKVDSQLSEKYCTYNGGFTGSRYKYWLQDQFSLKIQKVYLSKVEYKEWKAGWWGKEQSEAIVNDAPAFSY